MNISQLIEFDRRAKENGATYERRRGLYECLLKDEGPHFTGIVGPRGAGKTILLKQLACSRPDAFYLSMDTLEGGLFECVKNLHETIKVGLFLLDEVHAYHRFEADLKRIYDFLKVKAIFTSSTALSMYESGCDLSRRVILRKLYPFSLREYAMFKYGWDAETLSLQNLIEGQFSANALKAGEHFASYLQGGLMPFALQEPEPLVLLANILETVIKKDIPRIARLSAEELNKIEALVRFIGRSGIDGINYSSVAQNLHITKYKADQYITLLEKAFILHRVLPMGSNVLREPKIVMALPYRLLYKPFEEAIGGLREDFFVEMLKATGREVFYLKSVRGQKTPDYFVQDQEGVVFEIGGKGKGRSQFKNFKAQRKIVLADGYDTGASRRPLFLVGLLSGAEASISLP